MDTNELLLAYNVRDLVMRLLANQAPKGSTTDQIYKFQRDNYEKAVQQVMADLEYTAELIANRTRR